MKKDSIYISGCFCEENEKNIEECEKQLQDINVALCKHDLSGEIYHSALDFMDLEMVAFSYELLRNFISSGSYDLFKSIVLKLWVNIRDKSSNKVPFTISIDGIPTIRGIENIKCKIEGSLTRKQKEKIIVQTFELAKQIEKHQFKLLERGRFYDAFNAHVFKYDSAEQLLTEVDIEEEIKKLREK